MNREYAVARIMRCFSHLGADVIVPGYHTLGSDEVETLLMHALDGRRATENLPPSIAWILEDEED